ncbi:LpxL/LpxP family Kdo(2)-lipid IV(A) lauroyl/palmitoleoyl acyltransferase [Neptunicella sp. SCSIO 80796]|uniref:LpxL/LpxP family Kdo(2)-lipid IV(A) lauroyl/palmitoleoyl acyltransferase n=1 Tax=Neptunicella plasticusilytica TaxID=3117012 RepID=UPI003A4D5785
MHVVKPVFQWSFLAPKYWPTWLAVSILYLVSWLPYRLQLWLGKGIGKLLSRLLKSRRKVAERNLQLCFPQMPEAQRQQILEQAMHNAGMALLESGMGWWWPDWRVKKWCSVEGYEHIQAILDKGKGVLGLAIHNMNLEINCRGIGMVHPSVVFYRRHNNPLMEYFQYHGRARSNKLMIHKKGVAEMLKSLNNGDLCVYLPDQDYGPKRCEFVPFFAVEETATTTGTMIFADKANCESVFLLPLRTERGYVIKVLPGLENFPSGDDKLDVARINRKIEEMIMVAPEQYLWMHKRFKTRPRDNKQSLY